jgi:hypothetical protein
MLTDWLNEANWHWPSHVVFEGGGADVDDGAEPDAGGTHLSGRPLLLRRDLPRPMANVKSHLQKRPLKHLVDDATTFSQKSVRQTSFGQHGNAYICWLKCHLAESVTLPIVRQINNVSLSWEDWRWGDENNWLLAKWHSTNWLLAKWHSTNWLSAKWRSFIMSFLPAMATWKKWIPLKLHHRANVSL